MYFLHHTYSCIVNSMDIRYVVVITGFYNYISLLKTVICLNVVCLRFKIELGTLV